jgi:hypothetical protein
VAEKLGIMLCVYVELGVGAGACGRACGHGRVCSDFLFLSFRRFSANNSNEVTRGNSIALSVPYSPYPGGTRTCDREISLAAGFRFGRLNSRVHTAIARVARFSWYQNVGNVQDDYKVYVHTSHKMYLIVIKY